MPCFLPSAALSRLLRLRGCFESRQTPTSLVAGRALFSRSVRVLSCSAQSRSTQYCAFPASLEVGETLRWWSDRTYSLPEAPPLPLPDCWPHRLPPEPQQRPACLSYSCTYAAISARFAKLRSFEKELPIPWGLRG